MKKICTFAYHISHFQIARLPICMRYINICSFIDYRNNLANCEKLRMSAIEFVYTTIFWRPRYINFNQMYIAWFMSEKRHWTKVIWKSQTVHGCSNLDGSIAHWQFDLTETNWREHRRWFVTSLLSLCFDAARSLGQTDIRSK